MKYKCTQCNFSMTVDEYIAKHMDGMKCHICNSPIVPVDDCKEDNNETSVNE